MSWFRSEEMEYRSFIIRDHVAHDVVEHLAEEGLMQFVDVSSLRLVCLFPCPGYTLVYRCKVTSRHLKGNSRHMCADVVNWRAC